MTDKAISINKTVKIVLFGLFLMHCPILSPKYAAYAAICLERLKFHKNCYFLHPSYLPSYVCHDWVFFAAV